MQKEGTRRTRILVIDDDEVIRELMPALLRLEDGHLHVVSSGDEALAWLSTADAPDVILTDLQMPGLEGDALVSALRDAAGSHTAFVGMSASRPSPSLLDLLDGFISKPFGAEDLDRTIETARRARASTQPESPASTPPQTGAQDRAAAESVPPLDETIFSALAQRFKPELLVDLYAMTLKDVAERHKRIEEYAATGDLAAVQREAHAIKGSCGMVGARELQQLAASTEGGTTLNTSAIADFPAACLRLQRMLDAKFRL